jgi:hypothetical protein
MKLRYRLAAAAIAVSVVLAPSAASTCTCGGTGSPLEELSIHDAVFSGLVLFVTNVPEDQVNQVLVLPIQYWKGVMAELVTVFTPDTDGACGYAFQQGETYLIYADNTTCPDGLATPCFFTGLCTRNNPLSSATEDLAELGPGTPVPVESTSWGAVKQRYE